MFDTLKSIRKEKHVTCDEMSKLLDLKTRSAYNKKENGNVPFSLEEAKRISVFFNMPIEVIFFENEVSKMET